MSRGLQDRLKLAEMLKQVFGALAEEVAARRVELLAPELRPGEAMPDAELEYELYLRLLDRRLDEAVEAERAYRRAGHRFKILSRRRDETTAELSQQLGGLRQVVDLARGKGTAAALLDIKGRTERRQEGVCSQAGDALVRLGELEPGESLNAGVADDPEAWRGMIEAPYRRLEALRRSVLKQQKTLDGLLIAKDQAFALFDETARGLVRIAEGQCQLVGRKDLAKRVRQFSRKRRRPGPKPKKKAKKGKKAKKARKAKKAKTKAEELTEKLRSLASARVA